jgi:ADP-heptose:LPS heptosyltransferase
VPIIDQTTPRPRILIVRFSSIGDIVLTSPVIRCLKLQLNAEIHFLTKRAFAPILIANPYIDQVHSIEKRVEEVLPQLRALGFDHIIDLHKNLRTLKLRLLLRKPWRAFRKLNLEKWLLVNWKIDRLPGVHIVDRYLNTVKFLGVENDGKGLDYFIPEAEEINVLQRFPSLPASGNFIAFAIGAAHATKRLPHQQIVRICKGVSLPVILLGGPGDRDRGEAIVTEAGAQVINTCGQLSLHQSASVVRQARQVITHDTGMMHIAAAFKKKIHSVWGNTVPEFGMTPYLPSGSEKSEIYEVQGLACRPCSKIGYGECPKRHFRCMQDIDIEQIVQRIQS